MKARFILYILTLYVLAGCNGNNNSSYSDNSELKPIPAINYVYLNSYPHDTNSFTEGLVYINGKLFESTGATDQIPYTKSLFGIVDLTTGKIETKVELDKTKYFGEGICYLNGKIFQLTYKNQVGFIYDATTYKKTGQFTFSNKEGWGLTTDGTDLIMSDGTEKLSYFDPNTLQLKKQISVSENGFAKEYLNELEFIKGYIYANIWTTNTIVKIDPANGRIAGYLNLKTLAEQAKKIYPKSLEMNGIAYDSITNRILVTGKLWPKIFEITFV